MSMFLSVWEYFHVCFNRKKAVGPHYYWCKWKRKSVFGTSQCSVRQRRCFFTAFEMHGTKERVKAMKSRISFIYMEQERKVRRLWIKFITHSHSVDHFWAAGAQEHRQKGRSMALALLDISYFHVCALAMGVEKRGQRRCKTVIVIRHVLRVLRCFCHFHFAFFICACKEHSCMITLLTQ